MADLSTNKLPWAEVVSCVSLSDTMRASAAKRFFEKKRFANSKNMTKRGLIRRLMNVVFDNNLSIIDLAQRIGDEIRENSDAKALNVCVQKLEQLGNEGWHRAGTEGASVSFRCADLDIQLQPDAFLKNDAGARLLLYAYYRQSPPLSTDAVRALLCLIRLSEPTGGLSQDVRIVIFDCYKDKSYEGFDFQVGEPWIAKQIDKVFTTFNAMYRIHLDGSPPPQVGNARRPTRRPRAVTGDKARFSIAPAHNQFCFQFV